MSTNLKKKTYSKTAVIASIVGASTIVVGLSLGLGLGLGLQHKSNPQPQPQPEPQPPVYVPENFVNAKVGDE
jgi:hypothetical protein